LNRHSHVHLAIHGRDGSQLQPSSARELLEGLACCLACCSADADGVKVAVVAALGPVHTKGAEHNSTKLNSMNNV
jgi:hypothetical protein